MFGSFMARSLSSIALAADASFSTSQNQFVEKVLGVFVEIVRGAGVLLLAYAIYQVIVAFQSDNSEAKVKAVALLILSVAIINLKSIMNQVFVGLGVTLQ